MRKGLRKGISAMLTLIMVLSNFSAFTVLAEDGGGSGASIVSFDALANDVASRSYWFGDEAKPTSQAGLMLPGSLKAQVRTGDSVATATDIPVTWSGDKHYDGSLGDYEFTADWDRAAYAPLVGVVAPVISVAVTRFDDEDLGRVNDYDVDYTIVYNTVANTFIQDGGVGSGNQINLPGFEWNEPNKTLTLTDFNFTTSASGNILWLPNLIGGITVVLNGTNSIGSHVDDNSANVIPVYSSGNLTFEEGSAGGSLVATSKSNGNAVPRSAIHSQGDLTLKSGSITGKMEETVGGEAVWVGGDLTIEDGTLIAVISAATAATGIHASGGYNQIGGSVRINVEATADNDNGINGMYTNDNINISGGTLDIEIGDKNSSQTISAIYTSGNINVTNDAKITTKSGINESEESQAVVVNTINNGVANAYAVGTVDGSTTSPSMAVFRIPSYTSVGYYVVDDGNGTGNFVPARYVELTAEDSTLGSEANPYLIRNQGDLAAIGYMVNNGINDFSGECLKVANDIVLTAANWEPIGKELSAFKGSFDGDGHSISGLSIDRATSYSGLFGAIDNGAIQNLTVAGSVTSTESSTGGIVGYASSSTLENCTSNVAVSGAARTGGIAGYVDGGTIKNCTSDVAVSGTGYVGGIAGSVFDSAIKDCTNSGTIDASLNFGGGIVGFAEDSEITGSNNSGAITAERDSEFIGGIVGYLNAANIEAKVTNCYNSGAVTGNRGHYGGIVGHAFGTSNAIEASIDSCFNSASISGGDVSSFIGGILGYAENYTKLTNCYNAGNISGKDIIGGIVGNATGNGEASYCYNTGAVSGLTTNVGGIVGYFNSSNLVSNSLSLGAKAASNEDVSRIANGNGQLTNNQARKDMRIGTEGNLSIPTRYCGADERNGQSLSLDTAQATAFAAFDTSIWDIPVGNFAAGGGLPTLRGIAASQSPILPIGLAGEPPVITTTWFPAGMVGVDYIASIDAEGDAPITFVLAGGSTLPTGLTMDADGNISGTPTEAGEFYFTVVATNGAGSVEQEISIIIVEARKVLFIPLIYSAGAEEPTADLWATWDSMFPYPDSFQWYKDGQPISGETAEYLSIPKSGGDGTYHVVATELDGNTIRSNDCVVEWSSNAGSVVVLALSLYNAPALLFPELRKLPSALLSDWQNDDVRDNGNVYYDAQLINMPVDPMDDSIAQKAKAEGYTEAEIYMLFGYLSRVEGGSASTDSILALSEPTKISFEIPKELQKANREFVLITKHVDGTTAVHKNISTDSSVLTVSLDIMEFEYAIAYKDIKDEKKNGGGGGSGGFLANVGVVEEEPKELPVAPVEPAPADRFIDVSKSDWFYNAVEYVAEKGIMNGTAPRIFEPNTSLNRAMMVQILYNLEGQPSVGSSSFSDVDNSQWYANAVAWAAENGIVSGIGGNQFAPTQPVTREQMAVMLFNYCKYKGIELPATRGASTFTDSASIGDWAREAVEAMYQAEILNGRTGGSFDPRGTASRAEVAQMMMGFVRARD